MSQKSNSLIQLNIAVLIWGGTAMFAKGITLPVEHIIGMRSLIGAAALLAFLIVTKRLVLPKERKHYAVLLTLGVLLCLHWLTYFQSLKTSTAAVAILSLHTYPVITALIEPFLFGEKFKPSDLLLAIMVFVGIIIMIPELTLSNNVTMGIALGVLSGIFFMVRNLITRRYVQEYSGSMLTYWQMLITGILLLPILLLSDQSGYDSQNIGLLILLGVLFTALPQTLFSASFKNLSAKTVGILSMLLPFYAAILGYLVHDEILTLRTAIGGSIILICIIYETLRNLKT